MGCWSTGVLGGCALEEKVCWYRRVVDARVLMLPPLPFYFGSVGVFWPVLVLQTRAGALDLAHGHTLGIRRDDRIEPTHKKPGTDTAGGSNCVVRSRAIDL
jgi:hypothetical protein